MIDGDNDNKKGNSSNDGMDVGIENAKEVPERVAYPIGGSFGINIMKSLGYPKHHPCQTLCLNIRI